MVFCWVFFFMDLIAILFVFARVCVVSLCACLFSLPGDFSATPETEQGARRRERPSHWRRRRRSSATSRTWRSGSTTSSRSRHTHGAVSVEKEARPFFKNSGAHMNQTAARVALGWSVSISSVVNRRALLRRPSSSTTCATWSAKRTSTDRRPTDRFETLPLGF